MDLQENFIYFGNESQNTNYLLKKHEDEFLKHIYLATDNLKQNLEKIEKSIYKKLKKIDVRNSLFEYQFFETVKEILKNVNEYMIILIFTKEKIFK